MNVITYFQWPIGFFLQLAHCDDTKYSNLIQIICIQLNGFKYFYLIIIICLHTVIRFQVFLSYTYKFQTDQFDQWIGP